MDRRMFVQTAAATILSGTMTMSSSSLALSRSRFFEKHALPIGVQLYTVDTEMATDVDGTLSRVAQLGYQQVELANMHGLTAQQMRTALDRTGLVCRSTHIMAQPFRPGPNLSGDLGGIIADAHLLGVTDIVMPLFLMPKDFRPPETNDFVTIIRAAGNALTVDDYHRMAEFLNQKGKILAADGLRLGYHNHNFEFAPRNGTTGFDILINNTDPALVSFEVDGVLVAAAGVNPVKLLKAHGKRFNQMHVKDIKATTVSNFEFRQDPTEVGSGKIEWAAILPVAYKAGIRRFFVEQEPPYVGSPMDALGKSITALKRY